MYNELPDIVRVAHHQRTLRPRGSSYIYNKYASHSPAPAPLLTSLQHLPQHPHQLRILQRSRHPLFISQLLVDLVARAMRPLLDPNVDPKPRR